MEGVKRGKVRLLPHNESWAKEFLTVKQEIKQIWGESVLDIQHFGSTAIQGVWAKPILDVAVIVKSFASMDINALTSLGYEDCGREAPDYNRWLFVMRSKDDLSLRHIHCYEPGNQDFLRCIAFRDYLNTHPEEAARYSDLKRQLLTTCNGDRYAFGTGKEPFIQSIYQKLVF